MVKPFHLKEDNINEKKDGKLKLYNYIAYTPFNKRKSQDSDHDDFKSQTIFLQPLDDIQVILFYFLQIRILELKKTQMKALLVVNLRY